MTTATNTWNDQSDSRPSGALSGLRVLDLCVAGPGPFCTLMLASHGASVIHVSRIGAVDPMTDSSHQNAGKQSIRVDLKSPEGRELVMRLAKDADVVLEGFRPGVVERLGVGPDVLCAANERLVYVRMTGWGQDGPYAGLPGHDINYLAISGALSVIGIEQPMPPMALLGDFAAGGLMAVVAIMAALRDRDRTGQGNVIDTNIVEGAAMLLNSTVAAAPRGAEIGIVQLLNGTAPFYRTYRCADGEWFSVGAIEPKFYSALVEQLGLGGDATITDHQYDKAAWPVITQRIAEVFATKTRSEWTDIMLRAETCAFPVVRLGEMAEDPHLAARGSATRGSDGRTKIARAGRIVGEPATPLGPPCAPGASTNHVLSSLGYDDAQIAEMASRGVIG